MKILSLFDGMCCGYIAMLGVGVEVDRYVAFEIDKYAVKTSSHNFPKIEHKGDVFEADFTEYQDFDFLVGGSPCTYWSIAQKNGRETEASGMGWELFQQYVRALHEAKPKYFIYENNKSMSKAIRASIDETFGFEAVLINSALVSAQNRQRLYWVGKRNPDGTYSKVNVEQPVDRGILLKDVLEGDTWKDEQGCIDANYYKGGNFTSFKKQSGERLCVAERVPPYGTVDKARPINAHYPNNCGGFEHRMFSDNPNKQQVDMIAESVVPFVEERLDKAVEKYGYLPKMWNPYNNAEITDKAPTLTTAANHTSSSTVLTYEPVNATADGKSQTIKAQYQQNNEDNFIVYAGGTFGASGVAEPVNSTADNKCHTLKAQYYKNGTANFITNNGFDATAVAEPVTVPICVNSKSGRGGVEGLQPSLQDRIYSIEGKSTAVTTAFMPYIAEPLRVGALPRPNGELSTSQAMRVYSTDGKSVNINSGGGGMGGKTGLYAIPVEFDGDIPTKAISQADGKTYRVHKVENGIINIKGKDYPIKLADGYYIIRKLTVRECMRLQTVPEWYEFPVSDAQAYKMLGNGWTCEVIIHLIKSCLAGKVDDFAEQIKIF